MNNFYPYFICIIFICSFMPALFAQNEFEQWKKREQEKFGKWADEGDKKFRDFLLKEWEKRKIFEGLKDDNKPKPKTPPVYSPVKKEPISGSTQPEVKQPAPQRSQAPDVVSPPPPKSAQSTKDAAKYNIVSFIFYGSETSEELPEGFSLPKIEGAISNKSIAEYWSAISTQHYAGLITTLQKVKEERKFNDWAYAQYVNALAEKLYGRKCNETVLFTWCTLIKSGYDCRVAYYGDKIFLMIATDNKLFGRPYFTLGASGTKYYTFVADDIPLRSDIEVTTYDENHPGAFRKLNFEVKTPPVIGGSSVLRNINFIYKDKLYSLALESNSGLIGFYRNYPQVNYQVYLAAPLALSSEAALINELRKLTEGMDDIEKAQFLLKFVQDATGYKTDQEQFGWEKPMFAEESLHYGYSDCEDRSILYSYLIRKLTKLQIILLDYPGHISTAIKFDGIREGDYVVYKGANWLVCDPTYLGADIGMNMPDYKKVNPQIIEIPSY